MDMLTKDDLAAIEAIYTRTLAPVVETLGIIAEKLDGMDRRLTHLETAIIALESRVGVLVRDVMTGRTSDTERLTRLEQRVAELEARLGSLAPLGEGH